MHRIHRYEHGRVADCRRGDRTDCRLRMAMVMHIGIIEHDLPPAAELRAMIRLALDEAVDEPPLQVFGPRTLRQLEARVADCGVDAVDIECIFHDTMTDAIAPTGTRLAVRFTVTGGSYALTSVKVPISEQKDVPDDVHRVRLTTDVAGSPGTTLEVLSENQGIWPTISSPFTTATTLSSASHPLLLDGAAYWIVSEPTSTPGGGNFFVEFRWSMNRYRFPCRS